MDKIIHKKGVFMAKKVAKVAAKKKAAPKKKVVKKKMKKAGTGGC
jgi:hypothetical protein